MIICVAEDRRSHEPALRILLHSFNRANAELDVAIFSPNPSSEFRTWVGRYSNFKLRSDDAHAGLGWSVKPSVMIRLLDEGQDEVIWLDSDLFINGSLISLLSGFDDDALVVAEEALAGQARLDVNAERARAWGFNVSRTLAAVNTCFMRINENHREVLEQWKSLMEADSFRNAQLLTFANRPVHLASDQDILTALLTSSKFDYIKVRFIRRGYHIIQYYGPYGFTTLERLQSAIRGLPPLIHSQASAPWSRPIRSSGGLKGYVLAVITDISPYVLMASRSSVALEGDALWLKPQTLMGRLVRIAGLGSPSFTGFPVAIFTDLFRYVFRVGRAKMRRLFS